MKSRFRPLPGDIVQWNLAGLCRLLLPLGRGRWLCWRFEGLAYARGFVIPRPQVWRCGNVPWAPVAEYTEFIRKNWTAETGIRGFDGLMRRFDDNEKLIDRLKTEPSNQNTNTP